MGQHWEILPVKPLSNITQAGRHLAGTVGLHDNGPSVQDSRLMDGTEMSEILREIGWEAVELARRLDVRQDTVRRWLTGRREIPPNLADWLRRHRDAQGQVPPLPENWRAGRGC